MRLGIRRPSRAAAASAGRRLVVLVSIAAVVGLVPALPAVGTPPETALVKLPVERWHGAPATGRSAAGASRDGDAAGAPWRVSPVVEVQDVVMVGADWGGSPDVAVEVRARRDGSWSDWTPLELAGDHAPDPGSSEAAGSDATSSEPVWLGRTDAVQLRRHGGADRLQVDLHGVTVSGGDGLAYRPRSDAPGAAAHASPAQPNIISRSQWGADESIRDPSPSYADELRFAVVHHTAQPGNDYDCWTESDDLVRSIYAYHVKSRGWDDIAYNFLVDKCGQVFEGRAGGVTEAVIGAHAAGWNGGSTGVVTIGNFDVAQPPQVMLDALDRLLAWKLDLHHVDPFSTTDEISGGGSSNRFEPGDRLTVPAIIGHRVTNATSCPGDQLIGHIVDEHPEHPRDQMTARWEPVAAHRVEPIGTPKSYGGPGVERDQPLTGHRPRWDVDFTEPLDWRLTIHDADGQLVRSTGGTGTTEVRLAWDLTDAEGEPVAPGTYTAELTSWSTFGRSTPIRTTLDVAAPATRVSGTDRVATALELSRWAFEQADRVVLATSRTYADALAATPLAGSFGGPVLLTPPDHLPDEVATEIRRLKAEEVWIIGGTAAVSLQVGAEVMAEAGIAQDDVHRLAGTDRFETAYEVADVVVHREGSTEVLVAVGRHPDERRAFPDALSAGALGAEFDLPIVLVEAHGFPAATQRFLDEHDLVDGVTIFGGTAAVSPGVEELTRSVSGTKVRRFAGADRYETSRLAAEDALRRWAEWEAENGGPSPYLRDTGLEVVTASGANWPDALGAGAAADERDRAVFLLVDPDELDLEGATAQFILERSVEVTHAVVAGGVSAVTEQVRDELARLVEFDGPHTAASEPWPEDPHAPPELPAPGPTTSPSASPSPPASPSPTASPSPSGSPSPGAG